ncbi:hypothetical protein H6F42_01500 [Pseudanabaena sp. FACHB-1998]|uniref:hypothetical protein n=1 Tax=Pseudanabaena sp. FACHB-1998 TaxID=2692858 RepID=UPI001680B2DD|nr:hypothetical protein [Pseudanabaena sp. FACHB-1998]MBD2175592.1 hypothetical protein [Pseudanabaena sp. FACHB-1998]
MFRKVTFLMGLAIAQTAILNFANTALAGSVTLKVYPLNPQDAFPICPTEITVTEQSRPYYEGGYTIDGKAQMGWLTREFKIASTDQFSVIWVAKLQQKYRNCVASAGIATKNNEPFQSHSYIRMRFTKGNAYLILDMTGMYDANRLTPVILKNEVKDGNPTWTWAGTD